MEELIHKIVGNTGITGDQAKKAIETVRDDLKSKFPSFLHGEIDNAISGGKFGSSYREKVDQVRDKIEEVAKEAGNRAETVITEIRGKLNEMFNSNKPSDNGK